MLQDKNKIFQWVTWITVLGVLACMLLPAYLPRVVFPALLLAASLVLGIYLAISWKNLNRTMKWSIGLSIIVWSILGIFVLGFNSYIKP
ncbi:MAG: hypothetical protein GXY34_09595 [Syntrophomonadaceae bacterium]|nr:hypothetical protein [Syntrophomonadaceae bacterium]